MTTQSNTLSHKQLAHAIQQDFPELQFETSSQFSWHAGKRVITYNDELLDTPRGVWALLHEIGHAQLQHAEYTSDIELLRMEVNAWDQAREIAKTYAITIDSGYVEDALDSYRDWLHLRSTCPTCHERCTQQDTNTYACHNCNASWHVSRSRHCRPYRKANEKPLN